MEKEKPVERPLQATDHSTPASPATAPADAGSVQSGHHGSRKGPGRRASRPFVHHSHHRGQSRRTGGSRRRERALQRKVIGRHLKSAAKHAGETRFSFEDRDDCPMKARVQELLQLGDQLYSKRFPLLTLWQSFAENFYPVRADMTRSRYISEEFASYLMTGRPVLAHRELSNALSSILRPRGMDWFQPRTAIDSVNEDRACKEWLDRAGATMRRVMYDGASQFTRATKEGDADYILFGQCVIEPRLNARRTGLIYRTWHLRDCVWAENADLVIDQFHRKWKLDARALCKLFPDRVAPEVKTRAEKDPFTAVNCRVIVLPSDEYDSYGKDENGQPAKRSDAHPFVRCVIDEDHQTILEEVSQFDLGYVIPRWVTIGGFSQYAYSPTAIVALPDARMLQQMTLTLIEIGQKIVDPPMIAVGDAIQGGTNLYAGAINWVDPDYDERTGEVLRPITLNGEGLQWGPSMRTRSNASSTRPSSSMY